MELTPEDMKAIQLLRRMALPRASRFTLLVGVRCSINAVLLLLLAVLKHDILMVSIVPLYAIPAVIMVNHGIVCRNGHPTLRILLKLVDIAAEECPSDPAPSPSTDTST